MFVIEKQYFFLLTVVIIVLSVVCPVTTAPPVGAKRLGIMLNLSMIGHNRINTLALGDKYNIVFYYVSSISINVTGDDDMPSRLGLVEATTLR